MLAADERTRAAQFRFPEQRRGFISSRGALREILGSYLNQQPAQLRFDYGPFGKPVLASSHGSDIRFSLSHSGDIAVFALTRTRDIGVDVEHVKADVDSEMIAEQFFTRNEVLLLRRRRFGTRCDVFYRLWTGKEAYLKVRGQGLGVRLDSFDLSRIADEPSCAVSDEGWRCSLLALNPAPGYRATVAVEGSGWQVCEREWQGYMLGGAPNPASQDHL